MNDKNRTKGALGPDTMDPRSAHGDHRRRCPSPNYPITKQTPRRSTWITRGLHLTDVLARTRNSSSQEESLPATPRSCTKARGLLTGTQEWGIQSKPMTLDGPSKLTRSRRATLRGEWTDQVHRATLRDKEAQGPRTIASTSVGPDTTRMGPEHAYTRLTWRQSMYCSPTLVTI